MPMDTQAILNKAKNTPYKHPHWFKEGGKSVYDAMFYCACTCNGDFDLDIPNTIKYPSQVQGFKPKSALTDKKDIIKYLVENEMYDMLVIRYKGKERGTDRGKLKIQTFLILSGYMDLNFPNMLRKKYTVHLKNLGNPDFRQDPTQRLPGVPNKRVSADTIPELQKASLKYIDEYNLGGGNFSGGEVFDEFGKQIGKISYNGRYWTGKDYDDLALESPKV